jgi:transaldolase/glucose-6-phosphate isomerase
MNRLRELGSLGQSVWLDYIRRSLLATGELERLIDADGVSGLTANPTIFEKAIAGSTDYDRALADLVRAEPSIGIKELYETLAIADIQRAADLLRPVYDRTRGADGFVSLEVSPLLAHDTAGTAAEGRRLWAAVQRPNLLIKVPATPEGIPAIETLIADGVNVNVTLMFSTRHHDAAMGAYLRGLARASDPAAVASVASFFVSRVDTKVDQALDAIGTPEASALRGKAGIANARLAYGRFRARFGGPEFQALRPRGARVQKVLWASTGVKDPRYRDTMYAEELVGPDTIDTMPPALLQAYRDHGRTPARTVDAELGEAQRTIERLADIGVDLDHVGELLLAEGVAAFQESFRKLFEAIEAKRRWLLSGTAGSETWRLGRLEAQVGARLAAWSASNASARVWAKDASFWPGASADSVASRLGWLGLPEAMTSHLDELARFAEEVRAAGFRTVVLLGMGGSSLAPQVYASTFAAMAGYPTLKVLDSTHPEAVRSLRDSLDLPTTLFVVSSKSGTTLEPNAFFQFFWDALAGAHPSPGDRFVAITDPGTPLERLARDRVFRRCFLAAPNVGGRYSALSDFGLLPAALIGVDVRGVLDRAVRMAEACGPAVDAGKNPGLRLGAALGELAKAGRDKVTFVASPALASFPSWAEQLIAESTGKHGTGIVPVADEVRPLDPRLGRDRTVVYLRLRSESDPTIETGLAEVERAGTPVVCYELADRTDLGRELFRWEFGVASAGAVLGIDPFDQPDVELAKELARSAMRAAPGAGSPALPDRVPTDDRPALAAALRRWTGLARPGDYVAIQAFLAPDAANAAALRRLRSALRDRLGLSTTLGFGPRFLHSTGQLHKGGPASGLFLQIVDRPTHDLEVPGAGYTFGQVIRAQALGDAAALRQNGRRLLIVDVGSAPAGGLGAIAEALEG